MRLLLDSHVVLWWLAGAPITEEAATAISAPDASIHVSAITPLELGIKQAKGRISLPERFPAALADAGAAFVPVTAEHAWRASRLPEVHGDPFDRVLVAQGFAEGLTIVTRDRAIPGYGVPVVMA